MAWFALGAILGLVAVIALYILPSKLAKVAVVPSGIFPEKQKQSDTSSYIPAEEVATLPPQALWYYLDKENNQYGPMSFNILKDAWDSGKVTPSTYLWNETMEEWKTLKNLPETMETIQT